MMFKLFTFLAALPLFGVPTIYSPIPNTLPQKDVLASHSISMSNRWDNPATNDVFKDNILLNIAYMRGDEIDPHSVNWEEARLPFTYQFSLEPGQTFAYHNDAKPAYTNVVKTTNAHFNAQEGFRSSGYLYGDGVCHLASLIYWTAKDAGLQAEAPTNHNFAKINEIPREYGVSIYSMPGQKATNSAQNLYVTNSTQNTVHFVFSYDDGVLRVSVA